MRAAAHVSSAVLGPSFGRDRREGPAVAVQARRLAGEGLPALDRDIDVLAASVRWRGRTRPVISAAMMVVPEPLNGS